MSDLDSNCWQTISSYLDQVLDIAESQRAEWLATLAKDDAAGAAKVASLLDEYRALKNEKFLERTDKPWAIQVRPRASCVLNLVKVASERRAFPRWSIKLDYQAKVSAERFTGTIHEMTENGLTLSSERGLDIGQELNVAWALGPNEPPLDVRCVVRHINPAHIGVEFQDLSIHDRLRIVRVFSAFAGKDRSS